ncbi:hypothetical protein GPALN_005910 [Globodera pallida]|nr:hypothetical protein GPALN_005910 [Globodera pallida]
MRSFAVVLTILALFAICNGMWSFGQKEDTVGGSVRKQERAKKDAQRRAAVAEAHQKLLLRQHEATMQSVPGFDGTPFLPNQSQSTGRTGPSTVVSPTTNPSNFTSGNPGSSKKGKSASKKRKSASKKGKAPRP